jgi:hypothetical protein
VRMRVSMAGGYPQSRADAGFAAGRVTLRRPDSY